MIEITGTAAVPNEHTLRVPGSIDYESLDDFALPLMNKDEKSILIVI